MEITLSSGKKVVTKEMTAYQSYLLNSFLTGSIDQKEVQGGQIPASVAFQMGTLQTLFKVDTVDGQKVRTPSNKKELIQAFGNFNSAELDELTQKMNPSSSDEENDEEDEDGPHPDEVELEKK
ncbi:hypothetical protein V4V35_23695 [Bacillus infantis]|uniref:hypothetical protein n=1 Tax=Bacillus infantis TaxID=324767 RepID=UPI002FBD6700